MTSALNMLNQARFIAGLQSVTLDENYSYQVSAATLLNHLNDDLSHSPSRPDVLAGAAYDQLYEDGRYGASHANLGWGAKRNLTGTIINGWCADDDGFFNILSQGHRRWVLNPKMGQTGFGATGGYTGMYSHDKSGGGKEYDVAWPAQVMPVEYFSADYPWSLSLGSWADALFDDADDWIVDPVTGSKYRLVMKHTVRTDNVTVKLVRRADNKTWNFSSGASDGLFSVNAELYGGDYGCVIFRPESLFELKNGDEFDVTVTVQGDRGSRELRYSVSFFSLDSSNTADTRYPVTGGSIFFSPATGTVTGCEPDVTEAVIPSEIGGVPVTAIGEKAFYLCKNLTGVTIPDSVASIGDGVFWGCAALTGANIPYGVAGIGDSAFGYCSGLTSVTIPDSVVSIGKGAFQLCYNLTDVYYGGSESQWNLIDIAERDKWDLTGAAIHYNSPMPSAPDPAGITVTVNGVAVLFPDAVPFIDANDRTMVPLRAVADAMGLDVNWDAAAREASFTGSGKTIIFPIDSTTARVSGGGAVQMDTAAVIVSERTYAPVRYLAEYFGYDVDWDQAAQTVIITG